MAEHTPKTVTREQIIKHPEALLDDPEVMRALITMDDSARGKKNVVDLRSVFMQRLETRIKTIEMQHNNVIAAAYDNISATALIHRAIIQLLAPDRFDAFLTYLAQDWAPSIGIQSARLCLELPENIRKPHDLKAHNFGAGVSLLPPGAVSAYLALGQSMSDRPIVLRQIDAGDDDIYGPDDGPDIRSEAVVQLAIGTQSAPAILVFGAFDRNHYTPFMATDLLEFYSSVFEGVLRGWLRHEA